MRAMSHLAASLSDDDDEPLLSGSGGDAAATSDESSVDIDGMQQESPGAAGNQLSTFFGVFVPCLLSIFG